MKLRVNILPRMEPGSCGVLAAPVDVLAMAGGRTTAPVGRGSDCGGCLVASGRSGAPPYGMCPRQISGFANLRSIG